LIKGWLHYTKFVEPELSEDPEYIFRMLVKPRSSIARERAKLIINVAATKILLLNEK
jgi:hypothetical protein